MKKCDLVDKELPASCPDIIEFNMGGGRGCNVSFRDFKNIYQDTDGTVYCSNCGIVIGVYPIGKIPFKRRDDNVFP